MAIKKSKKTAEKTKKLQKKVLKTKQKKTAKKRMLKPTAKTKKLVASRSRPVKAKKIVSVSSKTKTKKPAKGKESLDQKKETLRRFLIQKREQIVKEAKAEISKYIKGDTRQLVDTALDDGDWSIVDLSEDVSLKQLGTHRETLVKIDEALRKLKEGTYGICETCGGKISEKRLKVVPFAIHCRDCQEKIEQLEAIEKELPI